MRSKTLIYLLLILPALFINSYVHAAQLDIWPYLKQIGLIFSEDINQKIESIEQKKNRADYNILNAADAEDRQALEEAFNDLFDASRSLYEIYYRHCSTARNGLPVNLPVEFDRPAEFERRADSNMKKALLIQEEAKKTEAFTESAQLYDIAFDLELLALLNKGRALRIYQDYPILYEYPWDNDFTIMDGNPVRAIRVIEIDPDEKGSNVEKSLSDMAGVFYIVQIAAHTDKIDTSELNKIYPGDLKMNILFEDNWYKYFLGPYDSFEETERVFKTLDMRNAFIAAYLNGKRIAVAEARRIQAQQN